MRIVRKRKYSLGSLLTLKSLCISRDLGTNGIVQTYLIEKKLIKLFWRSNQYIIPFAFEI